MESGLQHYATGTRKDRVEKEALKLWHSRMNNLMDVILLVLTTKQVDVEEKPKIARLEKAIKATYGFLETNLRRGHIQLNKTSIVFIEKQYSIARLVFDLLEGYDAKRDSSYLGVLSFELKKINSSSEILQS